MKIFVQKKVGDGKLIFTFVTVLKRKIVLTKTKLFAQLHPFIYHLTHN